MPCRRLFALALVAGLWMTPACAPSAPPPAAGAKAPPVAGEPREVRVATASEAVWERVLRLTGELTAAEESTISTKVAGRLERLDVDVGTRVQAGQIVARIEAKDFELRLRQAQAAVETARAVLGLEPGAKAAEFDAQKSAVVREARADLDQAKRELERQTSLVQGGAATQSALDVATAAFAAAESRFQAAAETVATRRATLAQREAELDIASAQLADAQILAPYDGVVSERLAGSGDYLSAGAPLAHVLRVDPVRLRAVVPEQASGLVRPGQELRAHFDSGAPDLATKISRLSPALGARDRTLVVEADIPNPRGTLRPGAFARAELVLDAEARTLVVPPAALVRFVGIDKVFVEEAGVAVERRVKVGRIDAERVEIEGGLKAGERVVLDPGNLQGGARLHVKD